MSRNKWTKWTRDSHVSSVSNVLRSLSISSFCVTTLLTSLMVQSSQYNTNTKSPRVINNIERQARKDTVVSNGIKTRLLISWEEIRKVQYDKDDLSYCSLLNLELIGKRSRTKMERTGINCRQMHLRGCLNNNATLDNRVKRREFMRTACLPFDVRIRFASHLRCTLSSLYPPAFVWELRRCTNKHYRCTTRENGNPSCERWTRVEWGRRESSARERMEKGIPVEWFLFNQSPDDERVRQRVKRGDERVGGQRDWSPLKGREGKGDNTIISHDEIGSKGSESWRENEKRQKVNRQWCESQQ